MVRESGVPWSLRPRYRAVAAIGGASGVATAQLADPLQAKMGPFWSMLKSSFAIRTASHRSAKRDFPGSALESAFEGAAGNRDAPECAPRVLWEIGVLQKVLGSTFPEHPDFPQHLREHFPEHFQGIPV